MGKRLFTPGEDIPTPVLKRKSPLNRFTNVNKNNPGPSKKTDEASKEKFSVGKVVSVRPTGAVSTPDKRTISSDHVPTVRKIVSPDQKYNSPTRKANLLANKRINDLLNKPGPSHVNGKSGRKSSSEYSDSDVEFIREVGEEKKNNGLIDSDFDTDDSMHSTKSSVARGTPFSKSEDKTIVEWVLKKGHITKTNGNMIWKDLEKNSININGRSFHSLRNRFLRYIRPYLVTKYSHLLREEDLDRIFKAFPDLKKKYRPKKQLIFQTIKEESPKIVAVDEDSRSAVLEAGEVVYRREDDRESSPVQPAKIGEKLVDSSKKSPKASGTKISEAKKNSSDGSKNSPPVGPSGIQKNLTKTSEIKKNLCDSSKEVPPGSSNVKKNLFEGSKKSSPVKINLIKPSVVQENLIDSSQKSPDKTVIDSSQKSPEKTVIDSSQKSPEKNLIETSEKSPKNNLIETFTQKEVVRIEESDDESDIIKETPEEVLLERQLPKEKNILPPPEAVSEDEETQARFENFKLNTLAQKTETSITPVNSQKVQRLSFPHSSVEDLLKKKRRTEKLPTPLYRRSLKTKMTVNILLRTLDRIVNKKKRRRMKVFRPESIAVIKEEMDIEDDSKAVMYQIIKDSLKTCENLLTDSDSSNNDAVFEYRKKLENFSGNGAFWNSEQLSYEMVTDSDSDSKSSLETTCSPRYSAKSTDKSTISSKSTCTDRNSSKTTVEFPPEKMNQDGLLGNMLRQLNRVNSLL